MAKVSQVQARHNARVKALQALYQWDLAGTELAELELQFNDTQEMSRVDLAYFSELLHGVVKQIDVIDSHLSKCVDRPIEDLDPIEKTVCRIAAYEFISRLDVPMRVIINEGIEITKRFGADQGHKYVNGVLDNLARMVRKFDTAANKSL